MQIAEHWPTIQERLAQRAAPPFSIRAALGAIRGEPTTKVKSYMLRLDNVGSPEDLGRAIASVRGWSVSITIRARHAGPPVNDDERQMRLPGDLLEWRRDESSER